MTAIFFFLCLIVASALAIPYRYYNGYIAGGRGGYGYASGGHYGGVDPGFNRHPVGFNIGFNGNNLPSFGFAGNRHGKLRKFF